ncbi:glutathione S-transferase [Alphaproteobacteria bacterium 46_93_T64]|nr:glutathione S-transferase [Alphaproteobacteria bacterium 46_93_T64]
MIIIHHLNDSRSQRILWLLEELGLEYKVNRYERDAETRLAPPALLEVHPLGKSPVLEEDSLKIHETGAIVEYIIDKYDDGKLAPKRDSIEHIRYTEWIHYAEGSAMLPLLLRLYTSRLGDAAAPLMPRIDGETINHFSYLSKSLGENDYFLGDELSAADIMLSFPIEAANMRGGLAKLPNLAEFVKRIQARPAYKKALERGGEYSFFIK